MKSEEGFTLIEALLSLLITTIIMLLLSSGLTQAKKIKEAVISDTVYINHDSSNITGNRQVEWHLFLNQLERYLEGSRNPVVYKDWFKVEEWKEDEQKYSEVIYRRVQTNTKIFSRSENGGYQPILNGATRIRIKRENEGWLVFEHTFNGVDTFHGKIWVSSWVEEKSKTE